MELRRAADALLRSHTLPLAALLSPAVNIRWMNTGQSGHRGCLNRHTQRQFTSSVERNSIRPTATTTATPPSAEASSRPKSDPSLEEKARSLGWAAGARTAGSFPTLSPERERAMNGGSSARDLLATLNSKRTSSLMDVARMQDLGGLKVPSFNRDDPFGVHKTPRKPILRNPSTGRSVTIDSWTDVAKAFRLMEMSCARNKIKSDAMNQKFHERGGLKRKRLRRERWRARFKAGFKATVARVKQLKNQGW